MKCLIEDKSDCMCVDFRKKKDAQTDKDHSYIWATPPGAQCELCTKNLSNPQLCSHWYMVGIPLLCVFFKTFLFLHSEHEYLPRNLIGTNWAKQEKNKSAINWEDVGKSWNVLKWQTRAQSIKCSNSQWEVIIEGWSELQVAQLLREYRWYHKKEKTWHAHKPHLNLMNCRGDLDANLTVGPHYLQIFFWLH